MLAHRRTTDSFGEVRPLNDGLDFLPYSNAVHYRERRELFRQCVASGVLCDGYATDSGAGLHYEGTDLVTVIADRKNASAYRVTRSSADGTVSEESIDVTYLTR